MLISLAVKVSSSEFPKVAIATLTYSSAFILLECFFIVSSKYLAEKRTFKGLGLSLVTLISASRNCSDDRGAFAKVDCADAIINTSSRSDFIARLLCRTPSSAAPSGRTTQRAYEWKGKMVGIANARRLGVSCSVLFADGRGKQEE